MAGVVGFDCSKSSVSVGLNLYRVTLPASLVITIMFIVLLLSNVEVSQAFVSTFS